MIANIGGTYVGASIPLLRGLGKNNEINTYIQTSELNNKALQEELSSEMINYFSNLMISFLEVEKLYGRYQIKSEALVEAEKYKVNIYELVKNDILPKVEKNRADALYLQNELQLSGAKINMQNSYFDLEQILGSENLQISKDMPKPIDNTPEIDPDAIISYISSRKSIINSNIQNTPQYKSISYKIDENKIMLDYTKNQKKNPLVFDVRASYYGMYPDGNYNLFNAFSSTYPGYSFLFTLSHTLPIKNDQKKAEYLIQLNEYETSVQYLEKYAYESKVNALRLINNLEQLVGNYQQTKALTEIMYQSYLNEKEKFKYDNSTQIDIILSFDNYYNSLEMLNDMTYDIYISIVQLKTILAELPYDKSELEGFSIQDFFSIK